MLTTVYNKNKTKSIFNGHQCISTTKEPLINILKNKDMLLSFLEEIYDVLGKILEIDKKTKLNSIQIDYDELLITGKITKIIVCDTKNNHKWTIHENGNIVETVIKDNRCDFFDQYLDKKN